MNLDNLTRKQAAIGLIAVIAVAGIGAGTFKSLDNKSTYGTNKPASSQNQQGSSQKKVKLSNTKYAPYAYKISDDSVSQEEKKALAGFKVSKSSSGGVTTIHLDTTKQEYSNQTYHLKNKEELYFIETSMGDDSGGHEYAMEDDQGVVVDSNGYIIRT